MIRRSPERVAGVTLNETGVSGWWAGIGDGHRVDRAGIGDRHRIDWADDTTGRGWGPDP